MPKVLLRSNRRVASLGLCLSIVGVVLGVMAASGPYFPLRFWGGALSTVCAILGLSAIILLIRPRLAIDGENLWVFVRLLLPAVRVPLDNVEVFFMGQGAVVGDEPGHPKEYKGAVAANVIVRIAEADASWHARSVNPWLGLWSEGYITVRGLWCEDINQDLLKNMNHDLISAKRKLRQEKNA